MVLGGRAHHGRPADVDHLDDLVSGPGGIGSGLRERVQVDDHQVDGSDVVALQILDVLLVRSHGEDPGVDLRVQRLHATVEHFGEPGVVRYRRDVDPVLVEQAGGPSAGEDLHTHGRQDLAQVDDTLLVEHADESAPNAVFHHGLRGRTRPGSSFGLRTHGHLLLR